MYTKSKKMYLCKNTMIHLIRSRPSTIISILYKANRPIHLIFPPRDVSFYSPLSPISTHHPPPGTPLHR